MAQHTSAGTPNLRQSEIQRDRAWICVPDLREGRGTFRLFVEGDTLYDAMITAIKRAERDVRLNFRALHRDMRQCDTHVSVVGELHS